jgi:hypothetical protein
VIWSIGLSLGKGADNWVKKGDRNRLPGHLQCDANVAYATFVRKDPCNITLAGCWAHVRRNFSAAREQAPQRCGSILRPSLPHRGEPAPQPSRSKQRVAARMSQSRSICQRLHHALVQGRMRQGWPRDVLPKGCQEVLANRIVCHILPVGPRGSDLPIPCGGPSKCHKYPTLATRKLRSTRGRSDLLFICC